MFIYFYFKIRINLLISLCYLEKLIIILKTQSIEIPEKTYRTVQFSRTSISITSYIELG